MPVSSARAARRSTAATSPRATQDRALRPLLQDCRRLLSVHGEANGPSIAPGIVAQLDALAGQQRGPLLDRFFEHLARDFSPDPKQVLAAAVAYANAPQQAEPLLALQRVAEPPQLKTFCTLSPIPGLMGWLHRACDPAQVGSAFQGLPQAATERAVHALATLREAAGDDLAALASATGLAALPHAAQQALRRLAALYLVHRSPLPGGDPVARFHLDNGARLERLNTGGDLSAKGLKQSAGLMVNHLYDLARIETSHQAFVRGRVVHARALQALL